MNNYEYIIASLPDITLDYKFTEDTPDSILEEILEQCDEGDRKVIGFLESGFMPDNLSPEFYRSALSHENRFIREYFNFDLALRNAKVRFLNTALGRPEGKDLMDPECTFTGLEEDEEAVADKIFDSDDILVREMGIDNLIWTKVEQISTFEYFSLEAVLAFLVKLNIVARWFRLDEQKGREMFKRLVDEVRGTFKGVEYKE